jgi:dihydrofolate reductase
MKTGVARRQKGMSHITVQTHVTLDGVIESPPEALLPYMSDEGRQATLELALASDALLLGRVTWQQLAPAWREQTGAMAERFNAMPKYVVTSTLSSADEWKLRTRHLRRGRGSARTARPALLWVWGARP